MKSSDPIQRIAQMTTCREDGCWEWLGYITPKGYGQVGVNKKRYYAHRFTYEVLSGPIPEDKVLDHLCRNRNCVNPDHLEVVTQAVNVDRGLTGWNNRSKFFCKRGHEYTASNTIWADKPNGRRSRWCRECANAYDRQRYADGTHGHRVGRKIEK